MIVPDDLSSWEHPEAAGEGPELEELDGLEVMAVLRWPDGSIEVDTTLEADVILALCAHVTAIYTFDQAESAADTADLEDEEGDGDEGAVA